MTPEQLAAAMKEFAAKRTAYLRAHTADHNSEQASMLYDEQEELLDDMLDDIRYAICDDPLGSIARILEQTA